MRGNQKWYSLAGAVLVATGLCAVAEEGTGSKTVQLAELPGVVQTALTEAVNGAVIEKITPGPGYYVVKITREGALQAVTVSADGKACEGPATLTGKEKITGTVITWADLPEPVKNALSTRFQGAPINEVLRGTMVYTVVLNKQGKQSTLRITEDGKILPRQLERREELRQQQEQEFLHERLNRGGGGGPVYNPPASERNGR